MKDFTDGAAHCIGGPSGNFAQVMLELGEDLLDGIEVRGVFWQEEELGSGRADELPHGFSLVAAKIIHDDDIAGTQRGKQNPLDIKSETLAIDRPLEKPWRFDSVMT